VPTRYYIANSGDTTVPPITPAFDTNWEQTGEATRKMLRRKGIQPFIDTSGSATVTVPITTSQNILSRQAISDPLPATHWNGTISAVTQAFESALTANATFCYSIRVCSGDGAVFRGTLLSLFTATGQTEFVVSPGATRTIATLTLTPLVSQQGDRLVVEWGVFAAAPSAATTATLRYGYGSAVDYALSVGVNATSNPWLEFSQDIGMFQMESYKTVRVGAGMSTNERLR
jgi:hypothetical protein